MYLKQKIIMRYYKNICNVIAKLLLFKIVIHIIIILLSYISLYYLLQIKFIWGLSE